LNKRCQNPREAMHRPGQVNRRRARLNQRVVDGVAEEVGDGKMEVPEAKRDELLLDLLPANPKPLVYREAQFAAFSTLRNRLKER
jgi:hypothetical protein